ncbi:IucA/IucC family C-terminal-domain containing protein [Bacillus sp. NPDC077027]|uniref:IucA/IucC family C-terminal-domain containing protein n=1 Tax=Bacillus sp. NPDC077027 TaxID=3390548 RepID=UPI003D0539C9
MKPYPEWVKKELLDFGIQLTDRPEEGRTLSHLFVEENGSKLLASEKAAMHAPNLVVAASMFSKRYAYLVVSSSLYMMTKYNGLYQFPPEACSFREDRKLSLDQTNCVLAMLEGDRAEWRKEVVKSLFTESVTPLLHMLHRVSRLPYSILWENIAVRINSNYKSMMAEETDPLLKERIRDDYLFLKQADGDIFGWADNPFQASLNLDEALLQTGERKTCCMYYKLEKKAESLDYCLVCPLEKKHQANKKDTAC